MSPRYASGTRVSVEKTRAEIAGLLGRHGATHYGMGTEPNGADGKIDFIVFRIADRHFRCTVIHPTWADVVGNYRDPSRVLDRQAAIDAELSRRWRARLLWLKATLEFIEEEDGDVAEYLLPFLMLPDGRTVGEWAAPQVERMYGTGEMPPLLGAGTPVR